jgi:tetraacyldisaccharide 4'-kinase
MLSVPYGIGSAACSWARALRPARAGVPVISIGNLVAGGTGKTPLTVAIARLLASEGRRVAIVSRGHGRRSRGVLVVSRGDGPAVVWQDSGDEPYLMALLTRGVPVLVARRRIDAVRAALAERPLDAILLDDAFQHVGLARDLDIVAVDASAPLGNGRLLPAGLLREHPLGIARADLIVATRCDQSGGGSRLVARTLGPLAPRAPIVESRMVAAELWDVATGASVPAADLRGVPAVALSSVADPAGFGRTAREAGLTVVAELPFPDHHAYGPADREAVGALATRVGARIIATTEKDAVRLTGWQPPLPLVAVGIELEVTRGRAHLVEALAGALRKGRKDA